MNGLQQERLSGERELEGRHFWTPERKLLLGMLKRAVLDYIGSNRSEAKYAAEWFFHRSVLPAKEFSFAWVCEELNLNSRNILFTVRRMKSKRKLTVDHQALMWA